MPHGLNNYSPNFERYLTNCEYRDNTILHPILFVHPNSNNIITSLFACISPHTG